MTPWNGIRVGVMLLVVLSCTYNKKDMQSGQWKYCRGDYFGDIMKFDSTFTAFSL